MRNEIEINCGKLLIKLRKKHGISRYRLAKLTGLRESTIQNWETGGIEPTVNNFNKVLYALDEELILGKEGIKLRDAERKR
ncbi:MAG: helix-turn-helix domain-containing protein [Saccharofermentanales bacterium]|jgi:transcriptional regulator with XRE-family HTH domain